MGQRRPALNYQGNMIAGYLRVSTGKQHLANKKEEIIRYAAAKQITVDYWVTEISRLSRTLTDIMEIMAKCLRKKIRLLTTKEGYTTIDAGGTGTNFTSVYFVNWGERTCSGFFPKNGQAGLKKEDLGQKTVTDPNGNEFEALVTKWNWDVGLTVRDYRAVGALRNIDTAWFGTATSAQKQKLIENVIRVHDRLRDPNAIMYCSRSMYTFFKLCLIDKNNVHVDLVTLENGIKELRVDGLIVRKLDCISEKEAKVTNA